MQATMVQEMFGEACPASAPFFGYMGASAALIFASEYSPFFYSLPFACLITGPFTHVPNSCGQLQYQEPRVRGAKLWQVSRVGYVTGNVLVVTNTRVSWTKHLHALHKQEKGQQEIRRHKRES
jgi:hypothetical protein